MSKEKFVTLLTKDLPPAPKYFAYDAAFNCKSHPPLEEMLNSLKPLSLDEALKLKNSGAYLLDGRNADDYAKQHAVDSVNIPLKGRYATWAGTFIDHDKPVVVIADAGQEREAAMRLGRIGLDSVAGYVGGGMKAFDEETILWQATSESLLKV